MRFKENLEKIKNHKCYKVFSYVTKTLLLVVAFGFVLVVALQRFSNNKLSFFNYRMFTVVTGSMAPKYNIGDVLIAKYLDVDEINVGDTISYFGDPGTNMENKVITHDVINIYPEEGKIETKGIQNKIVETVKTDQYLGVVVHRSGFLTSLYGIINTTLGFYFLIIIPFMYIIGYEILAHMLNKAEEKYGEE